MWNIRNWLALFAALVISGLVTQTAAGARHHHPAVRQQAQAAASPRQQPALNETVLQAEVLLARAGFSPGAIDGRDGDNFADALHAF